MKNFFSFSVLSISIILSVSSVSADMAVFVNVNVIPMSTETVLFQQTVIVADGEITEIGHVDTISIPKNALIIDGTKRFLMPGLAEMHAHVTNTHPSEVDRLSLLVAAGLTPYEALRTGTVEVANFLGSNGGIIAEGKDADLVLLDSNPLDKIKNSNRVHGVMLRGKWLPSSELNIKLERDVIQDDK
ncbi:MAG: amidohydrolase family protein [Woeseiaceae bacterium]|nr:amidohydrolase family protein [Woeseiaceae bacterium]